MCVAFIISGHRIETCGELSTLVDPDECLQDGKNYKCVPDECLCWIDVQKVAEKTRTRITEEGFGFGQVHFEEIKDAPTCD